MRRTLAQIARNTDPRNYRDGGQVRGPGTGTSDSIPAKLSDGEFVLPADTVRKVGARRLRDLVHMTHMPVPVRGKNHLANGDFPEPDPNKRPNSFGDAAAAAQSPDVAQVQTPAPPPPVAQAPSMPAPPPPAATAPAPAQSTTDAVSQIPTGGLKAPPADGSQNSFANTETGRNLSNLASALPASAGALSGLARTGGAVSEGIGAAARMLGGLSAGTTLASLTSAPAAAQSAPAAPSAAGAGRGLTNPDSANPSLPPPPSPERSPVGDRIIDAPSGNVTRDGNSYSGTNVAGNISINGQPPQNGGGISPQNTSAADNLAANQTQGARARLMAAGTQALPNVQAPTVRNSTNDWQARNDLRNLEVSAKSITNTPQWTPGSMTNWRGQQMGAQVDPNGSVAAYRDAFKNDLAQRSAQSTADEEAMRQNANLQREGLQQFGATERANIHARAEDATNQIARGRLRLEQIAAGYSNRAADRMDRAQIELENAKTPEAQKSARERLLALAGKTPQNEWAVQVTPATKNMDGSTTQGSVWRYNKLTGETVRVDGGQQMDINKDPRAVAIRDNAKLSPQQKWAELQRLGYL